jgi:hypothetical protein
VKAIIAAILVLTATTAAGAEAPARIRDNLFLLEEAYNQEPGVIQHIFVATAGTRSRDWSLTFTEEWPVPTDRNQVSLTLPLLGFDGTGTVGLGDVLVNWRIQALGMGGKGPVAIAPRLSLVLPTGSPRKGTGRGSTGVQVNLPVSIEAGRWLVLHLNGGATLNPTAHAPNGRSAAIADFNAGLAVVVQPLTWMNLLVEVAWNRISDVEDTRTRHRNEVVVNPGLRFAIDHRASGLQVVPGFAVPVRVVPSGDVEAFVLAYLSFEHPAF